MLSATHIHSQSGFVPVFFSLFQHRFYLGDQLFLVGISTDSGSERSTVKFACGWINQRTRPIFNYLFVLAPANRELNDFV